MKIYATRNKYHDLDYYVGKDLFVKVRHSSGTEFYIKLYNRYENGTYSYNAIKADFVDGDDKLMWIPNWLHATNSILNIRGDMIELVEPVQVLSTDELEEIIKENKQ